MQIGPFTLENPLLVAPMAGISDEPFREQCLHYGAAMAVSEMLSCNPNVWQTEKSQKRMYQANSRGIRSVQIVGCDPELMAIAARHHAEAGADIIDINMGCPAKKVNKKLAGSALLQDPHLVEQILRTVVKAVTIPVTLKIRTGWDRTHRNGIYIAEIAEACGVQALTVHGRTRQDMFKGEAEYDTIRAIKQAIKIPVIANGDIDTPVKAKYVLDYTGADGIMIGRAAQGQPWLFKEILNYLNTGNQDTVITTVEQQQTLYTHVRRIHAFYGAYKGLLHARKHIGWFFSKNNAKEYRVQFYQAQTLEAQLDVLARYFETVFNTEVD
ncbi:MAG: tRNA dihydrouridine synthase DusB [Shewanellaceae bacterium]|nr:tRNA dihydrouridine synthase DusB [Shewanellaceae bacterium]